MASPSPLTISISTVSAEAASTVRALLQANLFAVFNERDASKRLAATASTYHADLVWYEGLPPPAPSSAPAATLHGRDALARRAEELLAEAGPDWVFTADGEAAVAQNLGVLAWRFGPPRGEEGEDAGVEVKGVDVIVVEDGLVKALWTAIVKVPGM